jgi:hypothetical protein
LIPNDDNNVTGLPSHDDRESSSLVDGLIGCLAFLTVFSFFPNPLFVDNEIIPYFVAPAIALIGLKDLRNLIVVLTMLGILSVSAYLARGSFDLVVTDTLQVAAVGVALFSASTLSGAERCHFGRCMKWVVFGVVGFMLLQRALPSLVDFSYAHLVRRDASAAELQEYTGGVPGIAPEPAYMGAYLVAAWIAVKRFTGGEDRAFTLACLLGVLLTASLSASLTFAAVLALTFATSLRRLALGMLALATAVALVLAMDSSLVSRVGIFVDVARSETSLGLELLSAIDLAFGSMRLASLVDPLSQLGCGAYFCDTGTYLKGYSLFAVLYGLAAPLHLLAGAFLVVRVRDRLAVTSVLLGILYGPVLNWAMYAGLLDRHGEHLLPDEPPSPQVEVVVART